MIKNAVTRLFILILFVPAWSVTAQDGNGLSVDAGQSLGEINPYVYGANMGAYTVPVDLLEEAGLSGITLMRFPNGNWGDRNNLSHFQIDLFMSMARLVGAQPSMMVRLENGTPEAAAEVVRYTNIEKEYGVQYWTIGNEPNLYDDYTTEDHNRDWRIWAEAMLAVDPTISLIGPEVTGWQGIPGSDPVDSEGRDWVVEFLRANGDLVDVVSIHRYPFPTNLSNPKVSIDDLRENTANWSTLLVNLRALVEETTGRDDLQIAVTEFNSDWTTASGGEATSDSFFNALWLADVTGRMLQSAPFTMVYHEMVTVEARGGYGLLAERVVRPTYYVYQLYQRFGSELVAGTSDVEYVSIYAARREDGALTLLVVNWNEDARSVPLQVENFEASGEAEVWLLDAEHNAENLGMQPLTDSLDLPPYSATLYVIPGE